MLIAKLLPLLSLAQVALGQENTRWFVDTESCQGEALTQVQQWTQKAQDMARKSGMAVLEDYLNQGRAPNRIMKQFIRLFGPRTPDSLIRISSKYDFISVANIDQFHGTQAEWLASRNQWDVEIRCNVSHIVPGKDVSENVKWYDTIQKIPVPDGSYALEFKGWRLYKAITIEACCHPAMYRYRARPWKNEAAEVIMLNPLKVPRWVKRRLSFDADRVAKAVDLNTLRRIRNRLSNFWENHKVTPVDLFQTPEMTILHEFTHTRIGGSTVDEKNGYGWNNSVKVQSIRNADSRAYFAVAVELIQEHNYDVDVDGNLVKFDD